MKARTLRLILVLLPLFSCRDGVVEFTQPEFQGKIVFRATYSQTLDFIYTHIMIAEQGREPRQLSDSDSCFNTSPDISPDGSRVVLTSCDPDYHRPIKLVNSDGSGLRILTAFRTFNENPRFSPGGRWIAFESSRDGPRQIFTIDSNGNNLRKITEAGGPFFVGSWSPDGRYISYFGREFGTGSEWQIYVSNADGSNQRQLTSGVGTKLYPTWSPDGFHIAYQREGRLHLLSSDGAMDLPVPAAPDSLHSYMYWSPNGDFLIFSTFMNGRWDIYRINKDGSGLQNLTQDSYPGNFPVLSPWDDRVAYVADLGPMRKIYLMNMDGTGKQPLTRFSSDEYDPRWGR